MVSIRTIRRAAVLVAAALASACSGDAIVVPVSEEPFLYLVLNERSVDRSSPAGHVGQHALLLTSGSPAQPAHYRRAERFEMRRASDGAAFAWQVRPLTGDVGSFPSVSLDHPNLSLPAAAPPALGADDIVPGETYELRVETGGRVIQGRVTVPARFAATVAERDGRRVAVWPRVPGAAGYRITPGDGPLRIQADTAFPVPDGLPGGSALRIDALDPGLFTYLTDDRTGRAGIDAGYGVFGALTSATLRL